MVSVQQWHFRYNLVRNVVFLAPNPVQNNKVNRMIPKVSESSGMFRRVSEALILRENGYTSFEKRASTNFQKVTFLVSTGAQFSNGIADYS